MAKNKKKKNDLLGYFMYILVIIVVFALIMIGVVFLLKDEKKENKVKPQVTTENVHKNKVSIEEYGINCDDNDTELYKKEYEVLKKNLTSDTINEEEYAKSVAKLFIIDLYTIKNKSNKYDVGGTDFVLPDILANYRLNVEDTIYKYVEDNSDGKRIQNLPVVSAVNITKTTKGKYKIEEKTYESYTFAMNWTYINDYEYDKSGTVVVIKNDKKMYVVEKK